MTNIYFIPRPLTYLLQPLKSTIIVYLIGFLMTTAYAAPENITLIADPKVLSIAIKESNESCIDLRKQTAIQFGPSPEIPDNTDYTFMRQEIYNRLIEAQKLLPHDIKFCIYEAYRSLKLQKALFGERYAYTEKDNPTWTHEQIFLETIKLVSPVINLDGSKNIPPHSTGGAFDIYLIDNNSKALDMGIHPADWLADKTGVLSQTNSKAISAEARKNRAIMNKALLAVGFANYPTEFWHWSYGDRYWAFMQKKPFAIYGALAEDCRL